MAVRSLSPDVDLTELPSQWYTVPSSSTTPWRSGSSPALNRASEQACVTTGQHMIRQIRAVAFHLAEKRAPMRADFGSLQGRSVLSDNLP